MLLVVSSAVGLVAYALHFDPAAEDIPGQRARLANRTVLPMTAHVEAASLLLDVKRLADPAMQGRQMDTPGAARARAYIEQRFLEIGVAPFAGGFKRRFTHAPTRGYRFWEAEFRNPPRRQQGVNIIGFIRGSEFPQQFLVLTAHYDHLGTKDGVIFPGADDNASGVAALLAVASDLKAKPPRHSVLLAALDGEEPGLLGAYALLRSPPVPLRAMLVDINLDMLSRSRAGELNISGLYANPQLQPITDALRATAVPMLLYGHDHPRPFWDQGDWTRSSDHGPFHEAGIPFLYLGVEDHVDYHSPSDTFENMDQPFYIAVVNTVIDLVGALDAHDARQLAKPAQASRWSRR